MIPPVFQPHHPIRYPSHNVTEFERWYLEQYEHRRNHYRTYLPILWTNYYCKYGYGKDKTAIDTLQRFLNTLPKTPYYTICQFDDGILNALSGLDIFVFSMSGRPMDYPLPLIAQPHPPQAPRHRDIFCNFVGRNTHPIREQILKISRPGYHISSKNHKPAQFADILNRSTFTLCPRGYGPTSFRIQEALQFGSIPVYVSDKFILPHAMPFGDYGVLIRPEQVKDIPQILKDTDPAQFTNPYKTHFTYESVKAHIDHTIQGQAKPHKSIPGTL